MVKVFTATLQGLHPHLIEVEVEAIRGTPQFILIGLPSKAVVEAKERIISALINCGVRLKSKRTIVNLAPADLPKHSSALDLAIAVAILSFFGHIKGNTNDWLFLGELSLNGQIRTVRGILPLCLAAKKMGFQHIVIPSSNLREASIIEGITVHPLKHLKELININLQSAKLPVVASSKAKIIKQKRENPFKNIIGQEKAKRAVTIAAAGGHSLLMIGPPGVGKSMLAESIAELLPPLDQQQVIKTTAIHSVVGENNNQLITQAPFRSPHHTITKVGLIGGGNQLKPGEISLAHNGVLFLDELTEFDRATLESLRQPLETGFITHARQSGSTTYPCQFLLVAATNPCPCGWYQSQRKACRCSITRRQQYLNKLSGPFLDRIDLKVWIDLPENSIIKKPATKLIFNQLPDQIKQVRERQKQNLKLVKKTLNSQLKSKEIRKICRISDSSWQLLKTAQSRLGLSFRGVFSTLRVAQTIALLSDSQKIEAEFVAEALQYRTPIQLTTEV